MKTLITIISVILAFEACQSKFIAPRYLIDEWSHAYQIQIKTSDGNWGPWNYISTLAALPNIEFTSSGRFLRDGKDGAECCTAGNKYSVSNNIIIFSDTQYCPQMSCLPCKQWEIVSLNADTLILEACSIRSKFGRVK